MQRTLQQILHKPLQNKHNMQTILQATHNAKHIADTKATHNANNNATHNVQNNATTNAHMCVYIYIYIYIYIYYKHKYLTWARAQRRNDKKCKSKPPKGSKATKSAPTLVAWASSSRICPVGSLLVALEPLGGLDLHFLSFLLWARAHVRYLCL